MGRLKIIILSFALIISTLVSIPASNDYAAADYITVSQALAPITFTNVSGEVGLAGASGNFFAWGDYNNDGYQDLLVNGRTLYKNSGPPSWKFTDVTASAKISSGNYGTWGDYDNDGYLDFYAPGQDKLWHNNGDGTFSDVTAEAGEVRDNYPSVACGWGDYDRDGDIDLYIANYEDAEMNGFPDTFWRKNGDGTFTNATAEAGIIESEPSRGVSWGDYNDDGWPDIYISNYRIRPNYLWQNNKNGTFTNVAVDRGVEGHETVRLGTSYYGHTVGSAWADYDNDGDLDLWSTNLAHKDLYRGPICDDSYMFRNDGAGQQYSFTDVRSETGIPTKNIGGGEDELMVGVAWGDYDNDGYQDLFLPQIYNDIDYAFSYLYHNDGDGTFTEVSNSTGVRVWDTYGGAWCDYNNDGWLDLVTGGKGEATVNGTHEIHLYKNNGNANSWLQLTLTGTVSNTAAIGARVEVTNNITTQLREVEGGMGSHSMQNSLTLEYGWGSYSGTVDINIRWPSGIVQNIPSVSLNQNLKITEPPRHTDLRITVYYTSESYPIAGEDVEIQWWIFNIGEFRSSGAKLICTEEKVDTGKRTDYTFINITGIETGENIKVPTIWNTTGKTGDYKLHGRLVDIVPEDINDSNNIATIFPPIKVRDKNELPVAVLEASPVVGGIGTEVTFNASKSTDDIRIEQYRFYYGDGTDSGWTDEPVVTHEYTETGEFDAYVLLEDYDTAFSNTQNPDAHQVIKINESIIQNHAPVINKVDYKPKAVAPGGTVKITVDAIDEDGDELTYEYSADTGWFTEFGPEVIWTAPEQAGEYNITVYVTDGFLESEHHIITVTVSNDVPQNLPPVINSISVTPQVIGLKGDATVTVDAYDPEDNELLYIYSTTGGSISGTGPSVRYISSGIEGTYRISAFVSDGELDSLSKSVTIQVFENDPPEISAIVIEPELVPAGGTATIKVVASDPEGETLSYNYMPEAGDISGSGNSVVWSAPSEIGEYEITVTDTDPLGFSDRDSLLVEVIIPGEGPQIIEYEMIPTIVGNDGTSEVLVNVKILHPLGHGYIESVYIDLSSIGGRSRQKLADDGRRPDEVRNDGIYTSRFGVPYGTDPGDYIVYVEVEDIEGLTDSVNFVITISDTLSQKNTGDDKLSTIEKVEIIAVIALVIIIVVLFAFYFLSPRKTRN